MREMDINALVFQRFGLLSGLPWDLRKTSQKVEMLEDECTDVHEEGLTEDQNVRRQVC